MNDPNKEWQDGKYVNKENPPKKPPTTKINWKSHAYRTHCLERGCDRLVDPNINPLCRKCRRARHRAKAKENYKKTKEDK